MDSHPSFIHPGRALSTATVLTESTGLGGKKGGFGGGGGFQPVNRGSDHQNRWNLGVHGREGRKGCTQ